MTRFGPRPAGAERPFAALGIGECSLDRLGVVRRLPQPGEKVEASFWTLLAGGQVATALLAAARLGHRVAFHGCVGDDPEAALALAPLCEAGIDLSRVLRCAGVPTRTAVVLVEPDTGERTIVGHRDPRLVLPPSVRDRADFAKARCLLIDASDPEHANWAACEARSAGLPVVLDVDAPGPGVDALLAVSDYPIVSEGFADARFGGSAAALEGLRDLGAAFPVVTRGARGCVALRGEGLLRVDAFRRRRRGHDRCRRRLPRRLRTRLAPGARGRRPVAHVQRRGRARL